MTDVDRMRSDIKRGNTAPVLVLGGRERVRAGRYDKSRGHQLRSDLFVRGFSVIYTNDVATGVLLDDATHALRVSPLTIDPAEIKPASEKLPRHAFVEPSEFLRQAMQRATDMVRVASACVLLPEHDDVDRVLAGKFLLSGRAAVYWGEREGQTMWGEGLYAMAHHCGGAWAFAQLVEWLTALVGDPDTPITGGEDADGG